MNCAFNAGTDSGCTAIIVSLLSSEPYLQNVPFSGTEKNSFDFDLTGVFFRF